MRERVPMLILIFNRAGRIWVADTPGSSDFGVSSAAAAICIVILGHARNG
jgi:hypothetical protein